MMRRRSFLKLLGLTSLGAAIRLPFAAVVAGAGARPISSGGRYYKADGSDRIYVSLDKGKTWALHSALGPDYAVVGLAADRDDRLHATVGYSAWTFELMLAPNQTSWLTA
jgi:hypothetical protein